MRNPHPDVLYHGTGVLQLAEIIASGYIEISADDDFDDSGIVGVSLTSDLDVAWKFANEAKERDWEGIWNSPVNDAVVLHLNARSLSNAVNLTSVTWDSSSIEAEYRTSDRIYAPLRFIDHISIDPASLAWWHDTLVESGELELAAALGSLPSRLMMERTAESVTPPV